MSYEPAVSIQTLFVIPTGSRQCFYVGRSGGISSIKERRKALDNLEQYINNDDLSPVHPLIKMAVIHVQFESIHPFYDGNGRTGRIINILYLVQKELLDLPVLYLSRYIVRNKPQYYQLLQRIRTHSDWENWILYMLE